MLPTLASFAELTPLVYTHRINLKLIDLHQGRVYDLLGYDRDRQAMLVWQDSNQTLDWIEFEARRYQFTSTTTVAAQAVLDAQHPADFAASFQATFASVDTPLFTEDGRAVRVICHNTTLAGDPIQICPQVTVEYVKDGSRQTLYYAKDHRAINFLFVSARVIQARCSIIDRLLTDPLTLDPHGSVDVVKRAFERAWVARRPAV